MVGEILREARGARGEVEGEGPTGSAEQPFHEIILGQPKMSRYLQQDAGKSSQS